MAGSVPAADMFKEAQDDNRLWTWLIRLGGCVAMFIGFALIMNPLSVLADLIPILGDIVGTGIVAFLCIAAIAPVVIAIAWFAYRPVVAGNHAGRGRRTGGGRRLPGAEYKIWQGRFRARLIGRRWGNGGRGRD